MKMIEAISERLSWFIKHFYKVNLIQRWEENMIKRLNTDIKVEAAEYTAHTRERESRMARLLRQKE